MIEFYERYRRVARRPPELVLIGKLAMAEPRVPGVRYLGFLSEEDKAAAMAGARVLVCPSPFESLSIVLLEGFALGTPALTNARSEVLRDHCLRSNGGLYYESAEEFAEALDLLVSRPDLARRIGEQGRRYVAEHYRWPQVVERYRALIDSVAPRA
jgi:glycosyltransferase involved in cell wall biosynthesis